MDGNIEITKSNAYFFLDSLSDDMIFYTACNSQRILFGTLSNSPSAFSINSSLTSFHQLTNFHSNIGIYESNPKTSIHTSRDFFIGSNNMNWPIDHGTGLYMRYSTTSTQNASYIQSINRDGANSIIEYKNLNIEASNIYISTGINSSAFPHLSILTNGSIGINTIAPNEKLHVNGNILTQGNLILNSTQAIIYGSNYGTGFAGRIGYSLFSSNSLDIIGGANSSQTGRVITFYINSNIGSGSQGKAIFQGGNLIVNKGNIGIGQSNPLGQLHLGLSISNNIVIDTTNEGFSSINFNGYSNNIGNTILNSAKNRWRLYTDQTGTNDIFSIDVSDSTTSYNYLYFRNKNAGFNTSNPKARIHIVGTSLSNAGLDGTTGSNNPLTLEDNSGYAMRILHLNTNATDSTIYNYQTNKNVYWGESNDIGSYIFRGRNVCIGNSNGDIKLCVGSGSTDITSAIKLNTGDSYKIYFTNSNNGSKIGHSSNFSLNIYAGQSNFYNGSITFLTGSNTGYQERMIIDKTGFIGIGTHTPEYPLHVIGTTTINGASLSNASNSYIRILGKSNQLTGVELLDISNNGWIINKSNSDLLFINSNGQMPLMLNSNGNIFMSCNIGIGILNPESQVHISTTLQVGTQTLLTKPNQSKLSLRGNNQTVSRQWNIIVGAESNSVSTYNTQRLRILDSNLERMTINTSGYIGIGTSNPSSLMHLLSSTIATSISTFETTASNAASYISFKSSNASACYIGADGINLLNVSPGALTLATANNFNILFATSNQERMRITSNGNVLFSNNIGINTLIPTEKLHVSGNILSTSINSTYGKISGPVIELLGGTNASVYYQCYVESVNQGIHLESKSTSNTGLPFYINTTNRGNIITGGSIYPVLDNSNSSLGLINNKWTSLYASNAYLTTLTTSNFIAVGSITSSNNCTLTSTNTTGVRLNFKRPDIADNWFIRGPDTTSYSHMMIGYNTSATDCNVMRLDSGAIAGSPAKGLAIYGGITAYSNSVFPATLTASNLINQTYYSVTADVSSINYGLSNVLYGPGTVNGMFTFTPNSNLTYNIGNTAFTSFIPPVSGLWRIDSTLVWPQTFGSYYGISLVKNYANIFGSSTPGGTIVDWYKIGYGGASNTRPTSIYGKDLRYNMSGTVFLSTSDSLTTVLGYTGANIAGSNIASYTDCKITISLIQRSV